MNARLFSPDDLLPVGETPFLYGLKLVVFDARV
jgi:hypothetical protein